jgi:hypothetical protein
VSDVTLQPGDYNYDGRVDTADYVAWRKGLGNTFVQSNYDVWRAHFDEGTGAAGTGLADSAAPVPEPTTAATVIIAFVLFGVCSRTFTR